MQQPKPLTYTTPYKTVVIETLSDIKTVKGVECLDGGTVQHNGKTVAYYVQIANKPDLAKLVLDWRAEWDAYNAYKAAEFAANVPGLDALRTALEDARYERRRYRAQLDAMMDDEGNDGTNPPAPVDPSLDETARRLAAEYPRAAVYLRAEGYTRSNNVDKYIAGKKAMEIIATGGTIEDAVATLDNWLPEGSRWN